MSTRSILPLQPSPEEIEEQSGAEREAQKQEQAARQLTRSARAIRAAQIIIATAMLLAICYLGKIVLVTLMVSLLLAFVLEPLVSVLERIRLPRALGSFVAILVLLGVMYGISYFFYNRAVQFIGELPKYSQHIRGVFSRVVNKTNQLQQVSENVFAPSEKDKNNKPVPVTVLNKDGGVLTQNIGTVTEIVFILAFIPFLTYFMLSWQEHARSKTVELFRPESRTTAYVTLGQISLMLRSFIDGNFILGLCMGICSVVVFGFLGLPYFYFLGIISGFLSLIPYLGIVLAAIVPLAAGIGVLGTTGIIVIIVTVFGLHIVSLNVLYPKIIGRRLQLNPLVVTIGLLVWGFIWGAMGLLLAVPILGAIKIICDHVPNLRPIGAWMGE